MALPSRFNKSNTREGTNDDSNFSNFVQTRLTPKVQLQINYYSYGPEIRSKEQNEANRPITIDLLIVKQPVQAALPR